MGARSWARPMLPDISPAQGKMALFNSGRLTAAQEAVDAHPYEPVRIYWNSATTWQRNHPYIAALALEIGMGDIEVDALWDAARRQ